MNILPVFPSLIIREKIKDYDKYKEELILYSYEQQKKDPLGSTKVMLEAGILNLNTQVFQILSLRQ
tara:strand:- start:600 stop:797 length:198 start_codon:yes stop_codon:yes gene_type:complete